MKLKYDNNDQIRQIIKDIMKEKDVTYDDIAKNNNMSRQNAYSLLSKNKLKIDDVKLFCDSLGYEFHFDIIPKGSESNLGDMYDLKVNNRLVELIFELLTLAKDVDLKKVISKFDK